ncbi:hypothetical protein GON01_02780 [Sphingomonas sp. MAH-20]|uniref:Uncharacterized protein n=1 Tax=Sphingomonas horti TaxID=2682842 RepID=A0A6I4IY91_9SPHN|nr:MULTISPECIES: hypothetical protein [Sphingomonas]MBA2920877.1 hypothetical protein [Sphingomonas sp. CGMCC 1.13658]MVO76863.1 hypothetical protein [Sphingomonas horti]
MWALMDEEQRKRALQRGAALIRWNSGEGFRTAAEAAVAAGVKLVRFYQMNKDWNAHRSLSALGVSAAPRARRMKAVRADLGANLQAAAAVVVDADEEASVRQLALDLENALRSNVGSEVTLPSHNTLRSVIEAELRRRRRKGRPGEHLLLDHCGCGILRPDLTAYEMFAILDSATHLVIGASLGDGDEAMPGYSLAAADALERLGDQRLRRIDWAQRVAHAQVVPGEDDPRVALDVLRGAAPGIGLNVTKKGGGRYILSRVGPQLGVLPLWRTRPGLDPPRTLIRRAPVLEPDAAAARLKLEVTAHNDEMLEHVLQGDGDGDDTALRAMLSALAGM